ncbi:glycosyltransferase family 2 protein [Methanobrevibacter sp. OttesenSCG-928-I08]|nr:glycosyltransferase family 2 protein [Methanobrevibacter sp. OttesenSCG-928-I08]
MFNEEFYLEKYPKVSKKRIGPLEYYLIYGYLEGHIPSLDFDPDFYLTNYVDVKNSGMNPLVHYALYGANEGKLIQKSPSILKHEEIINTNRNILSNYNFDEEPLVSIIILNRNGITHLKRLFKDFREKTNYDNFEIIIVDNASSDESLDYLKELQKNLPIKIIENDINVSFSKGNNDAAKIANGEYLLLLNNDIEPTYGWLNEMMGTMLFNDDNVGAVGAKLIFPYYFDYKNKKKSYKIQHAGDIFAERIKPCCLYAKNKSPEYDIFDSRICGNKECIAVTGAVMLVNKEIYCKCGGLNEKYNYGLEDVDFALKLHKNNYKTIFSGKSLLFHHESSTRTKDKDYFENDKKNFNIFWNIWGDYLSKNMLIDKINYNNLFTEKRLKIVLIDKHYKRNKNSHEMLKGISKGFNDLGYDLDLITDDADYVFENSSDILVSFDLEYDISKIDARDDLVRIFSLNDFNFSKNDDLSKLDFYDVVICSKNQTYNYLKENTSIKHIFKINNESFTEYSRDVIKNLEGILKNSEGFL